MPNRPEEAKISGRAAGYAEEVAQFVGPVTGSEVVQHGAAGVGVIGGVNRAPGEVPQEPRVDGAHGKVVAALDAAFGEHPLEFGGREVWVGDQAGLVTNQVQVSIGNQPLTAIGGAAVLPDDGPVEGLGGTAAPGDDGLALIGDADGRHGLRQGRSQLKEHFADHRGDLRGVVLDPTRLGEVLGELPIGQTDGASRLVDGQGPHPGGSGIDCNDHWHGCRS